jgi:hypothetical protein
MGVRKRADKPRTEPRALLLLRRVNWATKRQKNGKKIINLTHTRSGVLATSTQLTPERSSSGAA